MPRYNSSILLFHVLIMVMRSVSQLASSQSSRVPSLPHIIIILADDLGYGDVSAYNPRPLGNISTPHIDEMTKNGMMFTDAHASSSVCTPSRYSLLTGHYNWRTTLKTGVLNGFSPPLIDPDRATIASVLKSGGYKTACIGKW